MLLGKSQEKLRLNPRKAWYRNLDEVTTDGDYAVTFVLKRPQPAFLMLLATGMSPVYPCHVPPRDMRTHPIGTGPFKFVEFKPNEYIRFAKNPDYWKTGPALSRRHRVDDHPEPLDPDARLYRRQVRHDLSLRGDGAVDARHPEPGAERDLRADADAGRDQPARQPRRSRPSTMPISAGRCS